MQVHTMDLIVWGLVKRQVLVGQRKPVNDFAGVV